jgi:hypothetical protein
LKLEMIFAGADLTFPHTSSVWLRGVRQMSLTFDVDQTTVLEGFRVRAGAGSVQGLLAELMWFLLCHSSPLVMPGAVADLGQDIAVHRAIPGLDAGNSGGKHMWRHNSG